MSHSQQHARKALSSSGTQTPKSTDSEWLDEVFQLLGNSRRRAAIKLILEHENIGRTELVDRVSEIEYGQAIEDISSDERHTIHVSLTQTHLPRLEENGIIERTGSRVMVGPRADAVAKRIGEDSLGSKLKRSLSALC